MIDLKRFTFAASMTFIGFCAVLVIYLYQPSTINLVCSIIMLIMFSFTLFIRIHLGMFSKKTEDLKQLELHLMELIKLIAELKKTKGESK